MINKDSHTQHISQQFNAELEEVRSHLLAMGGLVEKQVNDAVTALVEADSGLARQVREIDDQTNQMERDIDEACLRILARRQPAASDLRLVISISKSVIDWSASATRPRRSPGGRSSCARKGRRRAAMWRCGISAIRCAAWCATPWMPSRASIRSWRCRWPSTTRPWTASTRPRSASWPPT